MRIALFGNALSTMVRFRGSLICELKERGHDVLAICPDGSPEDRSSLTALGARHVPLFRFSRAGLNPIGEMSLLQELIGILRRERPDALFSYFLKPVIWGSIAARMAGVPRSVGMIEGMGATFSRPSGCALTRARQTAVRSATLFLLRQALVRLDHLIVLNPDDAAMIRQLEYIAPERMTCIDGIGIDLSEYGAAPPVTQPIRFAMVSRLLREKGVEQFAAAAEAVRARSPQVRFSLIGGLDDARGALDARQIRDWVARGLIDWHGHVSDVRPTLRESSVLLLPTLYSEGLPRSIMEAMAMARPVVTSDMPGARHSVTDGLSGFIHRAGDLESFVAACFRFIEEPERIAKMGLAARQEAERRYEIGLRTGQQADLILDPARIS